MLDRLPKLPELLFRTFTREHFLLTATGHASVLTHTHTAVKCHKGKVTSQRYISAGMSPLSGGKKQRTTTRLSTRR